MRKQTLFLIITFMLGTGIAKASNYTKPKFGQPGKPYHKSYITHQDLMTGGNMVITMSKTPNYSFGRLEENRPH